MPSSLPSLIHSSLGITSLLKRQPLKPNTIDRDKILVPPNWDSWGKIRVLRDGFDVEAVSNGWGEDIHRPWPAETPSAFSLAVESEPSGSSALRLYEDWIPDASTGGFHIPGPDTDVSALEVEVMETQEFLKDQSRYIEALRRATDSAAVENMSARGSRRTDDSDVSVRPYHDLDVRDHIGPVQFNMGGIQVDADDMLQRLKVSPQTPTALMRNPARMLLTTS
jgi:dynein light intermediate chain 1